MKQYIVLSHDPWSPVPTRTQHLVTRLGEESQVLFFQPASHSPQKGGKLVRPNVTVYDLPSETTPLGRLARFRHHVTNRQAAFIEKQCSRHRFRQPVLWLTSPEQAAFTELLNCRGIVYDCDRFWPEFLSEQESRLALAADIVFAASPLLMKRLSPCNPNVALVPNGVNYAMYSRPAGDIPADLLDLPRPMLGWVGRIDETLDLSPVLAIARQQPDWTIVLIGKVSDCRWVRELAGYPNVIFLGERPAVDLPDYLSRFDVLLHLRRKDDAESDVISRRIYQYLSTGRPIVSLLLPDEVEEFPDVIYSAHTPSQFVKLCRTALEENPDWVSPRRKAYGASAAWSVRSEEVRRILNAISL